MDKSYLHQTIEKNKAQLWQDQQKLRQPDLKKRPFTIILPPPNVTGQLHIGHAWDGFLQDCIIRFQQHQGYDTLFLPATDHAGIATQAKVEKALKAQQIDKYQLGRKKFLHEVTKWKDQYKTIIHQQWQKLGLVLDYAHERFTLDEGSNQAVNQVFLTMYQDGLIYRGKRAINWDPEQQTALSNIEVLHKKQTAKMYYIKYHFPKSEQYLTVATTRTETLPADVALVFAPGDTRYEQYAGQKVVHPFTKKPIPILKDHYVDAKFGTGIMKVSAHAIEDIRIIKEHQLAINECIDDHGILNQVAGQFAGLTRQKARQAIADWLAQENFLVQTKVHQNTVAISERSGAVVEILVKDQWFVKMAPLAQKLLKNLNSKHGVQFYPPRFQEVLRKWMEQAHDWCISRQLWWGHQIPAWFKGQEIKVQVASPGLGWVRDPDVLDTWFSSALAPFSFLGWPAKTKMLARYYPTSLLVTGYDIIFFWVARMYFQALQTTQQIPFQKVLIHGLIRDEAGRKMSKSLGNGIDPLVLIEEYGVDALRWFLLTNSTPGQDIRFSHLKMRAAWNLNNKLWNIARYILEIMPSKTSQKSDLDHWIWNQLVVLQQEVTKHFATYDFAVIGKIVQKFIVDDWSSWYIEMSKADPNQQFAQRVLAELLVIIHPLLPFITTAIWNEFETTAIADVVSVELQLLPSVEYVDEIIAITKAIRNFRAQYHLSIATPIKFWTTKKMSPKMAAIVTKLNHASVNKNEDALFMIADYKLYIALSAAMNTQETQRLAQEISVLEQEIIRSQKLLQNRNFLTKATPSKVALEQTKYQNYQTQLAALKAQKGAN